MNQLTTAPAPLVIAAHRLVEWLCAICGIGGLPAVFVDNDDQGNPVYACAGCGGRRNVPPLTPAQADAGNSCPPWCNPRHAHRNPGLDVEHESGLRNLATATLVTGDHFAEVDAGLYQEPGQPIRVALSISNQYGDATAELTPEEALKVAYGLINTAMAARAAGSR